jgi:hypothetical protein
MMAGVAQEAEILEQRILKTLDYVIRAYYMPRRRRVLPELGSLARQWRK